MLNSEVWSRKAPTRNHRLNNWLENAAGNGERDASQVIVTAYIPESIDADDLSLSVDQWATTVAKVDSCVVLDQVLQEDAGKELAALQATDDPSRNRVVIVEVRTT